MHYALPTCCLRSLKDPSLSRQHDIENMTFVKLLLINILNTFINDVFTSKNTQRLGKISDVFKSKNTES